MIAAQTLPQGGSSPRARRALEKLPMSDRHDLASRCRSCVSELSQRYGWGLSDQHIEGYVAQILRQVPARSLDAQLEAVVGYFHADHQRVAALGDQGHPDHRAAWAWAEGEIAYVAQIKGLGWSRDRGVELSDLVQVVVVEVVHALGDFRFESSLRTWLSSITVRRLLRFHRDAGAAKRAGQLTSLDLVAEQAVGWSQAERPILASLLTAEIERVLALSGDRRYAQIFLLRVVGDLTYEEIAQRLQLHPSRVRALLKVARDLLRANPSLQSWAATEPLNDETETG